MSDPNASPPAGGQGAANVDPNNPNPGAAADPANAGAADPGASPPPPPPPEPFYKSLKSEELRGYAELKGFKGADGVEFSEAVLKSYRELEKLRGVPAERLLTLPENMEDQEALKPILDRLGFGAPEKSEDYGLVTMDGADPAFAKAAEEAALKIGLPKQYAKPLAEWWNAYAAEQQGALVREAEEEAAAELTALRGEWQGKYDEKLEKARRCVRHLGFSAEELQAIETATGAGNLYRRFEAAFDKMGLSESDFVEGEKTKPGFGMTPEAAKVRIEELKTNRDWVKRYMNGDKAAAAEMQRLQEIAHPGFVQS